MTSNNQKRIYDPIPVEIPTEESFFERPFLAYGLFKKGELAHYKIEDCVDEVEEESISREMRIKDGSPLVIDVHDNYHKTVGEKISFIEGCEREAYEEISKTQLGNVYEWGTIRIGDVDYNILYGKSKDGAFLNVDKDGNYMDTFDGSKDMFFRNATDFIRKELDELDIEDECYIFRIQMYYMLLWTAIDRYCTLKYHVSDNQGGYLRELSNDKLFQDALKEVNPKRLDDVFSARNGTRFYFNRTIPNFIANVYYTIRSNVVHRGKEPNNRMDDLRTSLEDMLDIFDYIIENTFNGQDSD